MHPDEMIEISPIMDIVDKLEFKRTLSVAEASILTTCLTTQFGDAQGKWERDFDSLSILYILILIIFG